MTKKVFFIIFFAIGSLISLSSIAQTNVKKNYTKPYFQGNVKVSDTLGVDTLFSKNNRMVIVDSIALTSDIPAPDGNGIYSGNGSLSSNTTVTGAANDLIFTGIDFLNASSQTMTFLSTGQSIFSNNGASPVDIAANGTGDVRIISVGGNVLIDNNKSVVINDSQSATGDFQIKSSTSVNAFNLDATDGHVGQNVAPASSIQYRLTGDGSTYGFYVSGTNAVDYNSVGGASSGGFSVESLAGGNTGVLVEGNPAATGVRTGIRSHQYGTNTGANIALTLRAENGVNDLAIDIKSGDQIFRSGNSYVASSTLTQKGSDGGIRLNNALWNGASNVNREFEIKAVASTITNELTNLDFSYAAADVMSITSGLNIGIGTTTPVASSLLDLTSTTKGLLIPRMTTAQQGAIVSPATGLEIFNTTTNSPEFYNGSVWSSYGIYTGSGTSPSNTIATLTDSITFNGEEIIFNTTIANPSGTIIDNDATPNVINGNVFTYNGTANAVVLTDLDNPKTGAFYTLIGNSDTFTVTINTGGNFKVDGGISAVLGANDIIQFYCIADDNYIEISRSFNQ